MMCSATAALLFKLEVKFTSENVYYRASQILQQQSVLSNGCMRKSVSKHRLRRFESGHGGKAMRANKRVYREVTEFEAEVYQV